MRIVLVVGYMPIDETKELVGKWDNCVFIFDSALYDATKPEAIIKMVKMVDTVLVSEHADRSEKLCWEVACFMCGTEVIERKKDEVNEDGKSV